ncbi:PilZ domain-containing protein [Chromobacterium sp. IIBBL 290-4]|uniref:PilZ domain-containing protein n=1 Tax=Chromobacterium sp. IIBBL 290-4 TaxID=2953890 RepID=UPI0020B86D89|nr:PilZ domain-containing protein [Chromobacterium sp. IIBBL 290-4]UTH74025.1 PilZ domain-containing protein [Chromobacterium sp. IIBBL 290-4]
MFDFKSLVSSLLSKNTPASGVAQSATLLVRDLPQAEYFTALVEIIKAVSRINADTEMSLKERVKTLLYVDDKAARIHQQLCQDYLHSKGGSKGYLPTILAYWHELSNAYQICLRLYKNGSSQIADNEQQLIVVRGLHHQMRLIAWNALRYLKPEGTAWQQGFRYFTYAEDAGFSRQPVLLYPDSRNEISCEQLLVQAGMLFLAQTENMLHKEIIAVDQLLMLLSQNIPLDKQPPTETPIFVYNLSQPDPPQPMLRGMAGKWHRYWSAYEITSRLADLMFDLDNRIPSQLAALGCELEREEWAELCEKLAIRWSNDGGKSLRKSERSLHASSAQVSIGFDRVAFQVKVQDVSSLESDRVDEWRINDISSTGMGLTFIGKTIEQLAIGRLILVKTENHPLLLGIIRRILRQNNGTKVGIEILGQTPVGVSLLDPAMPDAPPFTAIYITQPNSRKGQRWFLMPKNLSGPAKELILTAQGKSYQIKLKDPQQDFEDCSHSNFDTLSKMD